MMPITMPAVAFSRPPYCPGRGVDLLAGPGAHDPGERPDEDREPAEEPADQRHQAEHERGRTCGWSGSTGPPYP